jgi:hypothetical protein
MNTDIAFAECTENSICNGVCKRVGIGMPIGAAVGSDVHTA